MKLRRQHVRAVFLSLSLIVPALSARGEDATSTTTTVEAQAVRAAADADSAQAEPATRDEFAPLAMEDLQPGPGFTVLTLEDAQRQALSDSPNLKAAAARVEQAKQRVEQAKALYYPQVKAAYSASHTELPESSAQRTLSSFSLGTGQGQTLLGGAIGSGMAAYQGIASRGANYDAVSTFRGSLSASYLVFDGFSRKFSRAIAEFGLEETEAAYQESRRLLLGAVAQSYYGLQLARENIAIVLADEEFNQRLLKDAQARRRLGQGSLSDVLNFEVRVRAARSSLLQSQNQYEQARIAVASLMGIPDVRLDENVVAAELTMETVEELGVPVEDEHVQYALEHHPNLRRSGLGVKRTDAAVQQRKSAYYPQVTAIASKDVSRNSTSAFDADDFSTTVGLNVSYTLFAGGQRKAAVAEARHQRGEAEELRAQAEIGVLSEVRQSLASLHISQQQLVLQRTTAEYVERNRELVEKEYEAGQGSLALLNQAQRDLIEAQARLAVARVSLRLAWHDLRAATSSILEQFSEQDAQTAEAAAPHQAE